MGTNSSGYTGSVPKPDATYGAGYLYHYDPSYQDFARRLAAVGGRVDIYEVLGVQFNSEPETLGRFAASLGRPVTLHSFEYCLGNVERPPDRVIERIQQHAGNARAVYIGEHIAIMGTRDTYSGGFFTPPGTPEQTQVLIDNLAGAQRSSVCPIIVENPSMFYNQLGPQTIGRQLREIAEATDSGILLSLSNISISENFHPQDREAMLAEIPLGRVRQLHVICGNRGEERRPGMEHQRREQEWALKTMEELAREPELHPASVIFELEAGTPSLAEPERLRDLLDMARDLFFAATPIGARAVLSGLVSATGDGGD
jgi:uncharacterized protein (UPF0276 family)